MSEVNLDSSSSDATLSTLNSPRSVASTMSLGGKLAIPGINVL